MLESSNRDEPLLRIPDVNDAKAWSLPKGWAGGLTHALSTKYTDCFMAHSCSSTDVFICVQISELAAFLYY